MRVAGIVVFSYVVGCALFGSGFRRGLSKADMEWARMMENDMVSPGFRALAVAGIPVIRGGV